MYHDQEIQLNKRFTERRAQGHRVSGRWLQPTMKHIVRVDLPDVDTRNKFKNVWLKNFCRRFRISWQRRRNKKNKGVMERLNRAKSYHWWLIYKMGLEKPHDMIIKSQNKKKKKQTTKKKKNSNTTKPKKKAKKPIIVNRPVLPKLTQTQN